MEKGVEKELKPLSSLMGDTSLKNKSNSPLLVLHSHCNLKLDKDHLVGKMEGMTIRKSKEGGNTFVRSK